MTIASILDKQVDRHPGKTAIRFENLTISYADLGARVETAARRLADLGAGVGTKIAHLAYNDISFFEVLFACSRLGAVMVPVNFRLAPEEIAYQLSNSETGIVVHTADFAETVTKLRPMSLNVGHWMPSPATGFGIGGDPLDGSRTGCTDHAPDRALVMIHTSGTTGQPKGAMLSERNILATVQNQIADFPLTLHDITLTSAPVFHAGGSLICTLPLLLIGGTVLLQKHFDPIAARQHMANDGVTCMFAAPAMWQAIIAAEGAGSATFPALRLAFSGGAAETEQSMHQFRKIFGVTLMQGYGLSECSSTSTILRAEDAEKRLGSVGKPMMTNRVRIVRDDGTDTAPGEIGEIVQSDDTVMLGYFNNPEATAETIRNGWLHTGDLGMTDADGFIYIKGRKKEMIISGGENIYPAEIEQFLNAHPAIAESAVVGAPDPKWGETPVAFVACTVNNSLTETEVIDYCKGGIASYKKPSRVIFVKALPRNPSGKVKKFELVASLNTN